jgi:hypothetical protein
MDNQSIQEFLDNLEKEPDKGLDFLISTGPEFFSTSELMEFRGSIREKYLLHGRLHRANLIIGASAPSWLVLGALCGVLGAIQLATLLLLLFPIAFLLFLGGLVFLRRHFHSRGYLSHAGNLVEQELARRMNETSRQRHQ